MQIIKPIRELVRRDVMRIERRIGEVVRLLPDRISISRLIARLNAAQVLPNLSFHQQKGTGLGTHIWIGGYCEDQGPRPIEIYLQYSESLVILADNDDLDIRLTCAVIHELTHRKQFSKGLLVPLDDMTERQYLSEPSELDAFSNEIAYELLIRGNVQAFRDHARLEPETCHHLSLYRSVFGTHERARKKLLAKVYRILHEAGATI